MFDWLKYLREKFYPVTGDVRPVEFDENPVAVIRHWNGYVREGSLKSFVQTPSPLAVAGIVLSLNDWVSQVRIAAVDAAKAHLSDSMIEAWIQALPLIFELKAKTRAEHKEIINTIEKYLQTYGLTHLRKELKSKNKTARRYAFELLKTLDYEGKSAEILAAIGSKDVVLATDALAFAISENDVEQVAASKPSFASIKYTALRWLNTSQVSISKDAKLSYLVDSSIVVRDFARHQFFVDKDEVRLYLLEKLRESSSSASTKRAAFSALISESWLSEAETAAFIGSADGWIASRGLLYAVGKGWISSDHALVQALQDKRRQVVKVAPVLVEKRSAYVSVNDALIIAESCSEPWRLKTIHRVFSRLDFWDWLEVLLQTRPKTENQEEWKTYLNHWVAREPKIATEPSANQKQRILALTVSVPSSELPIGLSQVFSWRGIK